MEFITYERRRGSPRGGLLLPGNRILDLGLAWSRRLAPDAKPEDTAGLIDSLRGFSSSILEIIRMETDPLPECARLQEMALQGNLEDCLVSFGDVSLHAPLPDPVSVVLFNGYLAHAQAELAFLTEGAIVELPGEWKSTPIYTWGNPASIISPKSSVSFPREESQIDFECHLAAVVSRDLERTSPEEAGQAILGYTLALVWTCRRAHRVNHTLGCGPGNAKGFSISLGPSILASQVPVPMTAAKFSVRVNGESWFEDTLPPPDFSVEQMLSAASSLARVPAGSVLLMGALPGASGLMHGQFLQAGDEVAFEVDELGRLDGTVSTQNSKPAS